MARGKGLSLGSIVGILAVGIAAIYLWGQLFTGTDGAFVAPTAIGAEGMVVWLIKFALIGGGVFLGVKVMSTLSSGRIGRKTYLTYILLGVALYFLWTYILGPYNILGATNFEDIVSKTALKLGLMS